MTGYRGGIYDKRPCKGEGFIKDNVYGVYVDEASAVYFHNLDVVWGKPSVPNAGEKTNLDKNEE